MNDNACNDATNRPVSLNNEATPDASVFAGAATALTSGAGSGATSGGGGGIYCNRKTMMRISNKRRISTERETIARIFMREKPYRMNLDLYRKKITMLRRRIVMNTCISTKRRTRAKKNVNLGMKKTIMTTMIKNNMKMRRNSGTRSLTVSLLRNLY